MFTPKSVCAVAALCVLPMGAYAQGIEVSAGVGANLYFDNDLDHVDESIEGYIEFARNGFYGGIWMGSIDDPTDEAEIEIYLGYGADVSDRFAYDISLTGYYLNDSGYQTYDITTALSYGFSETVTGVYELAWEPDTDATDNSVALEWAVNDKWTITPLIGVDAADDTYGEITFAYALTDEVSLEVLFEDSETSDPMITFSAFYDFSLLGG